MEGLWEKESDDPSALYVLLFGNMSLPNNLERCSAKNNTIANKYRTAGNKFFDSENWPAAIEKYTKSLCFAEFGTEAMGFAYANRANCYLKTGKYTECLADIDLAIKSNYPQRLLSKLTERKANCLQQQAQRTFRKFKLELDYTSNVNIPCMANVLEIQQNAEFGRHVVAKCDIPVGKIVLVEPSFVEITTTANISHCTVCQIVESNLMPCVNCTMEMFCSSECLERGRVYHSKECGYIFDDEKLKRDPQFVARTIFMALDACGSVDELMEFVESVRSEPVAIPTALIEPKDRYRTFLQFDVELFDDKVFTRSLISANEVCRYLLAMPEMAGLFDTLAKQRFLMHLAVTHTFIMVRHGSSGPMNEKNHGCTFALAFALFNHQCAPNVLNTSFDGKQVFVTTRPIETGEQLFISYESCSVAKILNVMDIVALFTKAFAPLSKVYDKYGFWCRCQICRSCAPPSREQMCSMENDEDWRAIRQAPPIGFDVGFAVRRSVQSHCITFLAAYGRLPHNHFLEYVDSVYRKCIECEYGEWE